MWQAIEQEEREAEQKARAHSAWLAKRQQKSEPVTPQASKKTLEAVPEGSDVQELQPETEEDRKNRGGRSPLLTSLLKSPSPTTQIQNPPSTATTTSPTIASLLGATTKSPAPQITTVAGPQLHHFITSTLASSVSERPSAGAPTLSMLLELPSNLPRNITNLQGQSSGTQNSVDPSRSKVTNHASPIPAAGIPVNDSMVQIIDHIDDVIGKDKLPEVIDKDEINEIIGDIEELIKEEITKSPKTEGPGIIEALPNPVEDKGVKSVEETASSGSPHSEVIGEIDQSTSSIAEIIGTTIEPEKAPEVVEDGGKSEEGIMEVDEVREEERKDEEDVKSEKKDEERIKEAEEEKGEVQEPGESTEPEGKPLQTDPEEKTEKRENEVEEKPEEMEERTDVENPAKPEEDGQTAEVVDEVEKGKEEDCENVERIKPDEEKEELLKEPEGNQGEKESEVKEESSKESEEKVLSVVDTPGEEESAVSEKSGKSEQPEMIEKAEKIEKTEKSEKLEKSEKSEKTEKSEVPEKSEKIEKSEKSEKPEKIEQAEKSSETQDSGEKLNVKDSDTTSTSTDDVNELKEKDGPKGSQESSKSPEAGDEKTQELKDDVAKEPERKFPKTDPDEELEASVLPNELEELPLDKKEKEAEVEEENEIKLEVKIEEKEESEQKPEPEHCVKEEPVEDCTEKPENEVKPEEAEQKQGDEVKKEDAEGKKEENASAADDTDVEEEESSMAKLPAGRAIKTYSKKQNAVVDSEPETETSDTAEYKIWKKSILLHYSRLATHKYASLFLRPITEDQAPGYHSVVFRPMDLSTIKKNIDNGTIRTNMQFQRDVMLMFQNAIMYNKSDSFVYKMAVSMQEECLQSMQILVEATGEGAFRRETRTATSSSSETSESSLIKRKRSLVTPSPLDTESPRMKKRRKSEND
uniref:Brd8_0 protein n=1 Tax=Fopius arisanus TaxID=64838 RepID=A0A0C9QGL3_9HYME